MKQIILYVLFLLAISQIECIAKRKFGSRIASGERDVGELNVAAFITSDNVAVCSGALIDDFWVLTAASCFTRNHFLRLRVAFEVLDSNGNPDQVNYNTALHIENAYNHTEFNPTTLENDIALVKLNTYEPRGRLIFIQSDDTNLDNKLVIAKGYGLTYNAAIDPNENSGIIVRSQILSVTENNSYCKKYVSTLITDSTICTPDSIACAADIGGLLMTEDSNELIGIISINIRHALLCGKIDVEPYTTYTPVVKYRPWIREITGVPL